MLFGQPFQKHCKGSSQIFNPFSFQWVCRLILFKKVRKDYPIDVVFQQDEIQWNETLNRLDLVIL